MQGSTKGVPILVSGTLTGAADTNVPSSTSIKTYVDTADALKLNNSASAYSTLANNTSGTATYVAVSFYDVPLDTYSGTITWNGTPPTTIISQQYAWSRIGNSVTLTVAVVYTNAGVTNTNVSFTMPTDLPTPATIAGMGVSASEAMYVGVGRLEANTTNAPGNSRSYIRKNAANTGYEVVVISASASAKVAEFTITYRTS